MPIPYLRCPKCGHSPMPADQALPAACPGCGVILAKAGQTPPRTASRQDDEPAAQDSATGWTALLTHIPERVDAVRFWLRATILAGLALWAWSLIGFDYRTGEDGGHDWIYLFTSMGMLPKAQLIGGLTHKAGALAVVLSLAWGAWLLRRQYARLAGHVLNED